MSIFSSVNFGGLQEILFPIIESLGGPDIRGEIAGRSSLFDEAADLLLDAANVLRLAADATADGILTNAEIEAIVAAAPTVADAASALWSAITGDDDEPLA